MRQEYPLSSDEVIRAMLEYSSGAITPVSNTAPYRSNKHRSKNTELMAEAIGYFIFSHADKSVEALESNEDFSGAAVEFNKLPKLKRLFDFYIINFWLASVACQLYYEHNDFQKICEGTEDGLYKSLESYEKSNHIHGLPELVLI